jgi:hypothetical protein
MRELLSGSPVRWTVLAILLAACTATSTPTPQPPIMWRMTQSPVFPGEWPPTSATVWARYTFAYGSSPIGLADGMYVTRPLTRTVVQRDGSAGDATALNSTLESVGIQGVSPLDAAASATLKTGPQVQTQLLQLTALPDEVAAAELREFYRTWIKLNGAFAAQIRAEHAGFFDWLGTILKSGYKPRGALCQILIRSCRTRWVRCSG